MKITKDLEVQKFTTNGFSKLTVIGVEFVLWHEKLKNKNLRMVRRGDLEI